MAGSDTLLTAVKAHLGYTWTDAQTDAELTALIAEAKSVLSGYCKYLTFSASDGLPLTLLKNYVMYARARQTDQFFERYALELDRLGRRGKKRAKSGQNYPIY